MPTRNLEHRTLDTLVVANGFCGGPQLELWLVMGVWVGRWLALTTENVTRIAETLWELTIKSKTHFKNNQFYKAYPFLHTDYGRLWIQFRIQMTQISIRIHFFIFNNSKVRGRGFDLCISHLKNIKRFEPIRTHIWNRQIFINGQDQFRPHI